MTRPTTLDRRRKRNSRRRAGAGGFTLIELLVVVLIVVLVSAVTLPTVIPAIQNRQVSEGARILQAALAGARDAAVRANAPRGIRLIPDPTATSAPTSSTGTLTSSRILPIEPAPDITDGRVTFPTINAIWSGNAFNPSAAPPIFPFPTQLPLASRGNYPYVLPRTVGLTPQVLMVTSVVFQNNSVNPLALPESPTNWFWNVRIGDKIRFADSGRYYTIVGPMTVANPENFVNDGNPGVPSALQDTLAGPGGPVNFNPQYLFLVNGVDDNNDGYPDQGVDGLNEDLDYDNNGNPLVDNLREWVPSLFPPVPNSNATDEIEAWLGAQNHQSGEDLPFAARATYVPPALTYTIVRRPVPTPGAREVSLPSACVIDLTTWNSSVPERSRLPVDPNNFAVDILLNQSGQVLPTTEFSTPSSMPMAFAFYHFWIADRSDVYNPVPTGLIPNQVYPTLPVAQGIIAGAQRFLKRDRQLLTLYTRTGAVVTNSIENFDVATPDPNRPYRDAQLGIREAK